MALIKKRNEKLENLLAELKNGQIGAGARLISLLEEGNNYQIDRIMEFVYPHTGHSWVIGITGPPGVGKSSLLNNLIFQARAQDKTVGAILVDPSSTISGGAVLGDRIRMSAFSTDDKVFLRSMGSRGSLGGLSRATLGAVRLLDYMRKDFIFVETVGSGQVDVSICDIADTVCLVLMPGAGDAIQSIKAGIREMVDIFVVNKCERQGVEETVANIRQISEMKLNRQKRDFAWEEPICPTNSISGEGTSDLWQKIIDYQHFSRDSEFRKNKKIALAKSETIDIILRKLEQFFKRQIEEKIDVSTVIHDIGQKLKSPQKASEEIFAKIANSPWTLSQLSEGRQSNRKSD